MAQRVKWLAQSLRTGNKVSWFTKPEPLLLFHQLSVFLSITLLFLLKIAKKHIPPVHAKVMVREEENGAGVHCWDEKIFWEVWLQRK